MSTTIAYRISLALLLAVLFYWLYPNSEPNPRPTWWQIEVDTAQPNAPVSVLGLPLAQSNLQQFSSHLQSQPNIAMFTKRQRPGEDEPAMHVEAYFEDLFDEGDRIIIGLDADAKLLAHIKKRAFQPELFPNDVIRVGIPPELAKTVSTLPIKSITLIAGWQVVFEEFKLKYGKPEKLLNDGLGNAHFLYPKLGLDFIQPAGGLQILQLVSPDQFQSILVAPLLKSRPSIEQ